MLTNLANFWKERFSNLLPHLWQVDSALGESIWKLPFASLQPSCEMSVRVWSPKPNQLPHVWSDNHQSLFSPERATSEQIRPPPFLTKLLPPSLISCCSPHPQNPSSFELKYHLVSNKLVTQTQNRRLLETQLRLVNSSLQISCQIKHYRKINTVNPTYFLSTACTSTVRSTRSRQLNKIDSLQNNGYSCCLVHHPETQL
jgi:hypothetical protein